MNRDGFLDYGEFSRGFIGEMNELRKSSVRKVSNDKKNVQFLHLSKDLAGGFGHISEIKKNLCPKLLSFQRWVLKSTCKLCNLSIIVSNWLSDSSILLEK